MITNEKESFLIHYFYCCWEWWLGVATCENEDWRCKIS